MINTKINNLINLFYFHQMTELKEILKHVEAIHELLLKMVAQTETTNEPNSEEESTNETTNEEPKRNRSIWNSSKFLSKEDRERVLEFMDDKVMEQINKQPSHKRVSFTQKLLKDKLKVNVSMYLTNKIINLKNCKDEQH